MRDSFTSPSGPRTAPIGWTPERQCLFLSTLDRTRSATLAARAAGLSRESAYRCRKRDPGGLFALMWDEIMARTAVNGVTVRDLRRDPPMASFSLRRAVESGSLGAARTR
ncbi:hypothetical protein [Sphingomonas astaxanthinifaciens]|uniref:Helix-turn-helix domain-containing protein n=1 Tax=Sphingomonas astaxanthinifaciens DSM 22298 TaxID=1123267 RepID=A0ABQ5Z638_9SPHN|nr:hypothetical protein [Sphingomonas astaxanthinifaciens]GLR46831.1 hypothetical protein GCM10007925_05420 [Sphingomonas astaxanthinifaciens DSM 22298]